MRILAVDDDTFIRELLPVVLTEAGITDVTVASSAKNALSVIAAQMGAFDCFLLDIEMPARSGIDLCRDIRKLPMYQKTPVIMLAAMQERHLMDDAFTAGATDYVAKPFEAVDVRARLRMAKLLVLEQLRVRKLSSAGSNSINTPTNQHGPNFDERLELGNLQGLVTTQSFKSYLGQLSRAGYQSSTFFAVHMQGARKIFDRSTPSEFEYALRHAADAIIASQMSGGAIACYVGRGNFICSSSSMTRQMAERLEYDVQDILDDKDLTFDDGSPLDIEVAIGATIQTLFTEPMGLEFLEDQTVKRAMARARDKSSEPQMLNVRRVCFERPSSAR